MIVPRRNLFKSELARKLNISKRTLVRFMDEREDKIKEIYPGYKKRSQILYPKVIDFIIKEMGYSHEEIYNDEIS